MARRGPLVLRSVRYGAYLLVAAAVLELIGTVVAALSTPGFELATTARDLLGSSGLAGGLAYCAAMAVAAVAGAAGMLLIWTAFPARSSRALGLLALVVAFLAQLAFGIVVAASGAGGLPQDLLRVTLVLAGAGLMLLSLAMLRDTRWDGYRLYTLVSGLVTFVGFVLASSGAWGPLGIGGAESLGLAPILLWLFVVGIHLARIPTFSPRGVPGGT